MPKLPAIIPRSGTKNLYMRVRRPDTGKPAWCSLGTPDRAEAERRRPKRYAQFLEKHPSCATPPDRLAQLRDMIIEGDRQIRSQISLDDRRKAAEAIRTSMAVRVQSVQEMALTRDFSFYRMHFPNASEDECLAMIRCHWQTLKDIQSTDEAILDIAAPTSADSEDYDAPKFSTVADAFLSEARFTDKDTKQRAAAVRDFVSVVGDRPIDSYTKEDMRAFKKVLLDSPAKWQTLKATRGKTFKEAARIARDVGLPTLSAASIRDKRYQLQKVFEYGVANYDNVYNIFADERGWAKRKTAANQRSAFNDDELSALVSGLDEKHFWLTWLGIATGARLEEITRLKPEDIRVNTEVPHILIKGTKTDSSHRAVPIHPRLVELGLHPKVPIVRSKARDVADATSKSFGRLLKRLGLKRPGLSFHSLRHTFVVKCRQASVDHEARERILGHTLDGMNAQYGDDYASEAIDKKLLEVRATEIAKLHLVL
ncbi:MAG: tyrosine-type recombinase/integrase [Pseudomonadota bacterium]